jgi:hypothetical protein
MKMYPKKFEDVFQKPESKGYVLHTNGAKNKDGTPYTRLFKREHKLSSWENITFENMTREEGLARYWRLQDEWEMTLFSQAVKIAWLDAVTRYRGEKLVERSLVRAFPKNFSKDEFRTAGLRGTFAVELERELGTAFLPVKQSTAFFRRVSSYIFHFFPREFFTDHDPFSDTDYFEYPFKHVTLEYLVFVYLMDERFEILKMAEEGEWALDYFRDWVVNYAYSFNIDYGDDVYLLIKDKLSGNTPYISDKRHVARPNASAKELAKKFRQNALRRERDRKRLGDGMVVFKTFAECFPQLQKKN